MESGGGTKGNVPGIVHDKYLTTPNNNVTLTCNTYARNYGTG